MRKVVRIVSGMLIMVLVMPFMLLSLVLCLSIIGLPIGFPMYLFGATLGAIGWRLVKGLPVNYTAMKAEKYAARAAKRDARHNKGFA